MVAAIALLPENSQRSGARRQVQPRLRGRRHRRLPSFHRGLVWFGLTETTIALDVLAAILALASVSSLALWALLVYGAKWDYASNILYKLLIFGHMLDASATSYGIDIHPIHYVEQHVVGSSLIEAPPRSMFFSNGGSSGNLYP